MEKIKLILLGIIVIITPLIRVIFSVVYLIFLLFSKILETTADLVSFVMRFTCPKIYDFFLWLYKIIFIIVYICCKAVFFTIKETIFFIILVIKSISCFLYNIFYALFYNIKNIIFGFITFLLSTPKKIYYLWIYFKYKGRFSNEKFIDCCKKNTYDFFTHTYKCYCQDKILNKTICFIKLLINTLLDFGVLIKNIFIQIAKIIIESTIKIYLLFKNGILFVHNLIFIFLLLLKSSFFAIIYIFTKDFWHNVINVIYNSKIFLKKILKYLYFESKILLKHFRNFIVSLLLFLWLDVLDFKKMWFYIKNNIFKFFSTIIIYSFLIYGITLLFLNPDKFNDLSLKWRKSFIVLNSPDLLSKIVYSNLFKPIIFYNTEIIVENGGSLYSSLINKGIDSNNANNLIASLQKSFDLRKVKPSWTINAIVVSSVEWKLDKIQKLSLPIDNKFDLIVEADNNYNYTTYKQEKKLTRYILRRKTLVKDSIYASAVSSGISPAIAMEVFKVLSWDIDFQRDIKENNSLEVIFECIYDGNDNLITCDNLLFASIIGDKTISFYKFDDGYFHEDGRSVIKTLVKTPINNARLSSGFGNRKHPVLGYTAFHKGVDFAAPTGTPIYASGTGVVTIKYTSASYGNYIRIQHNPHLSSAYAHMNGYAKNIKVGDRVQQWQIIGYVGSTGRATGPHLHYEVLINGKQINPLTIKMPSNMKLSEEKMQEFKNYKSTFNTLAVRIPTIGKIISPLTVDSNIDDSGLEKKETKKK